MLIPIILGTARVGRYSAKVANYVLEVVKEAGVESEILDVRNYRTNATDNTGENPQANDFAEKISKAPGLIIVMPEYNHGFPGELKMMLDLLYEEYENKVVGVCGVSRGPVGGARGLQQLRLTLIALNMVTISQAVYFANVRDLFDDHGNIKDESYKKKVLGLLQAIKTKIH